MKVFLTNGRRARISNKNRRPSSIRSCHSLCNSFEGGGPLIVRERDHKSPSRRLWAPVPRLRSLHRALGSKLPFRSNAGLLGNCIVPFFIPPNIHRVYPADRRRASDPELWCRCRQSSQRFVSTSEPPSYPQSCS